MRLIAPIFTMMSSVQEKAYGEMYLASGPRISSECMTGGGGGARLGSNTASPADPGTISTFFRFFGGREGGIERGLDPLEGTAPLSRLQCCYRAVSLAKLVPQHCASFQPFRPLPS